MILPGSLFDEEVGVSCRGGLPAWALVEYVSSVESREAMETNQLQRSFSIQLENVCIMWYWRDFIMSCLIVILDHRVCTVPEARLKVLPFTELSIGENQFNTEPTRGSCLINPFKKHTQTKSNICCHTHVDMHTQTTLLISKCTKYNYSFTLMVFFSLNSNR